MNDPVPLPAAPRVSFVVGRLFVLHTTPRSVTLAPPSDDTFPPAFAVVFVISVIGVVVTPGRSGAPGSPVGAVFVKICRLYLPMLTAAVPPDTTICVGPMFPKSDW